ncbi:hypothetical protein GCM10022247_31200 [Allokutzneria multivorans]|uniref:AB hydrolase-1 domain-containing protein n=1 Tax=Allokutzneria multivorans TaxID=1142134 RepID=A0ABP7S5L6_9PSEU
MRSLLALLLLAGLLVPASAAAQERPCGSQVTPVAGTQPVLAGSRPVLLVHGILSGRNHWGGSDLADLHRRLRGLPSVTLWTFDYSEVSDQWVTNDRIGPALARAVQCLAVASGKQVIVGAHSMGGLVTQYALGTVRDSVAGVFTVGTPFRGSLLLSVGQGLHGGAANLRPGDHLALRAGLALCKKFQKKPNSLCGTIDAVISQPVGRALTIDSAQIKALPPWPRDLPLLTVAGNTKYRWTLKLVLLPDPKIADFDMGDPFVSVSSATAEQRSDGRKVKECEPGGLLKVFTSTCSHSNLKGRIGVQNDIVEFVEKAARSSPPRIPATFRLPNEDTGTLTRAMRPWDAANACEPTDDRPSDSARLDMRGVVLPKGGDPLASQEHWQLATYRDDATAAKALAEIRAGESCTGQEGPAVDIPVGSGGFSRSKFSGAVAVGEPGDGLFRAATRIGNAVLLYARRPQNEPRPDLRTADPKAVAALTSVVKSMCEHGWSC